MDLIDLMVIEFLKSINELKDIIKDKVEFVRIQTSRGYQPNSLLKNPGFGASFGGNNIRPLSQP